ncbi:MAG: hypothetical protein KTR35_14695 [Gammaproteobacteria bacterium]|nr:hypothetical protein [Gammaproteobacteria bacterium]
MGLKDSSVGADRKQYYSATHGPFHNANNIFLFFGGGDRGQLIDGTIRSLSDGQVSITIAGEKGSGKTMMSLVVAERLQHRYNIIRYDHSHLSLESVIRHLLIEICSGDAAIISLKEASRGASEEVMEAAITRLRAALLGPLPGDKPFLLIIDSSQRLEHRARLVLEELASLETYGQPVFQFVLFEPSDDRAPTQPLSASAPEHFLRRLTLAEISEYLHHHMLLFDFNRRYLFTREMAYFIADRSDGVFRTINNLARNAFMIASLEDADRLSMSHLMMAGLPAKPESPVKRSFLVRHRRGVVMVFGFGIVASMAAAIALVAV